MYQMIDYLIFDKNNWIQKELNFERYEFFLIFR